MTKITKEFLRRVFVRDRAVFISTAITILVQITTWFFLIWRGLPLSTRGLIPLHYTIYFGVDLFGAWYRIFLPVLFGFIILIINSLIVVYFYERERLIAYIFAAGTAALELIMLVASVFVILLNM